MSGWTTRFGRAAPALRVSGLVGIAILCASIGAGGLTRAASRLDNARWLSSAEPQLAAALRAMPGGQRVVVMGRIDPVAPPVDEARGFALYLGEYYSTDSTWEWDYTIAPPFTVLLDDGPAEVLNGCRDAHGGWSIATPAYNDDCYRLLHLPVTEYNGDGNDRYRGFKPGDPVLVFGTAQRGGVIASAVSGGDLEEYADKTRWYNRLLEINIQNLAAVPSIVYGILGLAFLVRGIGLGRVLLAGAMILTLLVLPTVIIAAREAIRSVPDSIRQGAYALGATQWQVVSRQVLPAAIPGIATGSILALSRAIGETAPLIMIGAVTYISFDPTLLGPFTALPIQIYNFVRLPREEFKLLAAASIIVLLAILLTLNAFAIFIRNRYRRSW